MTILSTLAAFAFGVYLSIRLIVALYRILDLWYRIGTDYPRVIRGVLGWGLAIAIIGWLLEARARLAFLSGFLAFPLFYLSLFVLQPLLIAVLQKASDAGAANESQARE